MVVLTRPKKRKSIVSRRQSLVVQDHDEDDNIGAFLSKVNKARDDRHLQEAQLHALNTWDYLVLEAGAETFAYSVYYLNQGKEQMQRLMRVLKGKLLETQTSSTVVAKSPEDRIDESNKIAELQMELQRLR